jgi:hypothetical protein
MPLRPSERTELRRSGFKASVDGRGAATAQRVDVTVGICKGGRGSALAKGRGGGGGGAAPAASRRQGGEVSRHGSSRSYLLCWLCTSPLSSVS